MSEITEAPFEMANLSPRLTGLPMVVWVSERGSAPPDVWVKVCRVHGERMQWNNPASVAVRPRAHLAAGRLPPADLAVVSDWIRLNEAVLVDYWEERIFADELLARLRKLP
jgi:hypothetical protein